MAIYNGRILMRKGNEADFDPSKLMPGEWAVSLDAGIVRICLEAGKVIRMATYEAFEKDMKQIEEILLECQSIEEAVRRINTEVSEKLNACAEYVQQAKGYSEQAKTSEANSKSYMQSAKTSEENAKVSETNAKASENSAKEYENSAKLTEERAREVFESIPEDYSTISNDLYELAIKENASGEEIHVNDSSNLKLREFALYGKAKQNTTTGKNLIESVEKLYWSTNVSDTKVTKDSESKKITITTTDTSEFSGCYHYVNDEFIGKTCTVSADITISNGSKIRFGLNGGKVINITANQKTRLHSTETLTSKGIIVYTGELVAKTITVENLQFEYGEVATPFEEFTGGIASPNPSYPQPIEVSGESYNLLKNIATSKTVNGGNITVNDDKSITFSGTFTETTFFNVDYVYSVDNAENDVTGIVGKELIASISDSDKHGITLVVGYFREDKTNVNNIITTKTFSKVVFPSEAYRSRCYLLVESGTYNNFTVYPMIRKASVKNDRYMPYGKGSVEVKSVGEQLFDGVLELGRLANDTGNAMETTSAIRSANYIEVTGGDTITISNDKGYANYVYEYNEYKEYLGYSPSDSTHTLTLKPNTKYIKFRTKETGSQNDLSTKFMINSGAKILPYEPYKETLATIPTENGLCGIKVSENGNYTGSNGQQWICDEIVKYADGSGEKIQRVEKKKLTSDLSISKSVRTDIDRYLITIDSSIIKNTSGGICTFARYDTSIGDLKIGEYNYDLNIKNTRISVNYADYGTTTLEDFKAFLDSGEHYCIYPLAEPITTPLTAEEIAEIEKLHTFYPVTNISNDFDCGMSVTYYADSKNYISNQLAIMKQEQEEAMTNMLLLMPTEVQATMIENDTNDLLKESEI